MTVGYIWTLEPERPKFKDALNKSLILPNPQFLICKMEIIKVSLHRAAVRVKGKKKLTNYS